MNPFRFTFLSTIVLTLQLAVPSWSLGQACGGDCDALLPEDPKKPKTTIDLSRVERFSVGCDQGALKGYFRPENWVISHSGSGTAPVFQVNQEKGSWSIPVGSQVEASILIPSEGHLMIDWSSSAPQDGMIVSWEGNMAEAWRGSTGMFFSGLMDANDLFVLKLTNQSDAPIELNFESFQFLTRSRFVALHFGDQGQPVLSEVLETAPDFSGILFPPTQFLTNAEDLDPAFSGRPFLDADGHPASKQDQQVLLDGDFGWTVSYTDQREEKGDAQIIHRRWEISDSCSGNQIRHMQKIYLKMDRPDMSEALGSAYGPG